MKAELRPQFELLWSRYLESLDKAGLTLPPEHYSLDKVFVCSPYAAELCIKFPQFSIDLIQSGLLEKRMDFKAYQDQLRGQLKRVDTLDLLEKILRVFRNQALLRVIWRDIAGLEECLALTQELSMLADACIAETVKWLERDFHQKYGVPQDAKGKTQHLLVLALGKLGGQELNFSSDVDLIFAYPGVGETNHPSKPIANELFFSRLGQQLIHTLNRQTQDGFVFRVDMRLRPNGSSGRLVMSFDALRHYYTTRGRDWERYALIKARCLSGTMGDQLTLMALLHRFVYPGDVDFGALDALRSMHHSIVQEVKKKDLDQHIKLGRGCIRSIEFTVQAYQLIHGGQYPQLRTHRLFKALDALAFEEFMSSEQVQALKEAYIFMRNLEHRLQMVADQQTHQLPNADDAVGTARIAFGMGFEHWADLLEALEAHRAQVDRCFEQLIHKPTLWPESEATQDAEEAPSKQFWQENALAEVPDLAKLGFDEAEQCVPLLEQLRKSERYKAMSALGCERFNALMPRLLLELRSQKDSAQTLGRLLPILDTIMHRSTYMALFLEHPIALKRWVNLCANSAWIADQLALWPMLLGELIDEGRSQVSLDIEALRKRLDRACETFSNEQLRETVEAIISFKNMHIFKVAMLDVNGQKPLMRVSDHLTDIAIVVLEKAQAVARAQTLKQLKAAASDPFADRFAIIAYGKLGGIELAYGSDLDLVFAYEPLGEDQEAQQRFYTLMARELLKILEAQTSSGKLYEVDMRLRPSGDSGMLVSSLTRLETYQLEHAWTWEHQALTRARVVTGLPSIAKQFQAIRRSVLSQIRDRAKLRHDVVEMRHKMRMAARPFPQAMFDIKQGTGGITDIEFIVQYGCLVWGHSSPNVHVWTDNIRILESFAQEKLMTAREVQQLSDAYKAYRSQVHLLDLRGEPAFVPEGQMKEHRRQVIRIWRQLLRGNFASQVL